MSEAIPIDGPNPGRSFVEEALVALEDGDLELADEIFTALAENAADDPAVGAGASDALRAAANRFLRTEYWAARVLVLECLQVVEGASLGANSPERATTLWNLAASEQKRGLHERAEALKIEARSTTRAALADLTDGSFESLRHRLHSLLDLALQLEAVTEAEEAERLLVSIAAHLDGMPDAPSQLLESIVEEIDELRQRTFAEEGLAAPA